MLDIALAFLGDIVAAESICYQARNSDLDPSAAFPLEYPLVKVSIGTRKPLRFARDTERIDLTVFRITVPLGQVRAIFSAVVANGSLASA